MKDTVGNQGWEFFVMAAGTFWTSGNYEVGVTNGNSPMTRDYGLSDINVGEPWV